MRSVCIVGVGLIGGSLGMALKKNRTGNHRNYHVIGLGRNLKKLKLAKKRGAIDQIETRPQKALQNADVVILSMPVHFMTSFLRSNIKFFKRGATVSDVGSVKGSIVKSAKSIFSKRPDLSFVGAHPIAGSEKTGVENARADLFKKAICVITKDNAPFHAIESIQKIWKSVGAHCYLMSAAEHDSWLALTSHLPHLLSFAYFMQVANSAKAAPILKSLVAGSFRDMTRIAGADPDLWTGVIETNRLELKRLLPIYEKELRFLTSATPSKLRAHLAHIADLKQSW